jgi:hypothetical protein
MHASKSEKRCSAAGKCAFLGEQGASVRVGRELLKKEIHGSVTGQCSKANAARQMQQADAGF